MEVLYRNNSVSSPDVSIILLDWSCRESFHSLDYLKNQTVDRRQYEIIWIEYYNRRSPEIEDGLKEAQEAGRAPMVDQWIIMGMPSDVYFHKHLMYNIGIVAGRGKIITLCDSDAMFSPTFVESIISCFEEDRNIVLHMDEVRNINNKFYPFNYPSIKEITGEGCINWKDGKTTGLLDTEDILHTRNYGACMAALREDLIDIGGADEHIDYLGHICGPYEMTFRLVNAGKKEVWHQKEFLYHTWHTGTDGANNYLGPHDGLNMSTTALMTRITGRILPLVENRAIEELRHTHEHDQSDQLIYQAISKEKIRRWSFDEIKKLSEPSLNFEIIENKRSAILIIRLYLIYVSAKRFLWAGVNFLRKTRSKEELGKGFIHSSGYLKNLHTYHHRVLERSLRCIKEILSQRINEVSIYRGGVEAEILFILLRLTKIRVKAVYDASVRGRWLGRKTVSVDSITGRVGKIVITDLLGGKEKVEMLRRMGVTGEDIIIL